MGGPAGKHPDNYEYEDFGHLPHLAEPQMDVFFFFNCKDGLMDDLHWFTCGCWMCFCSISFILSHDIVFSVFFFHSEDGGLMLLCMFPGGVWSLPFVSPKFQKTIPYGLQRMFFFPSNSVLLGVLNAFSRCTPWCWMVCPPSRGSCLPLSPIVPLLVSLCWMVRPPSRSLVSPCLPLSPCSPCLSLSPGLSPSLSPSLSPILSPSLSPSLSLFLFLFVASGLIFHFFSKQCLSAVLNAFSCVWPCSSKHFLNPPTVWGLRWCTLTNKWWSENDWIYMNLPQFMAIS